MLSSFQFLYRNTNAETDHYARMEGPLYALIESDNPVNVFVLPVGSAVTVIVSVYR
jgi:hypothetical protein